MVWGSGVMGQAGQKAICPCEQQQRWIACAVPGSVNGSPILNRSTSASTLDKEPVGQRAADDKATTDRYTQRLLGGFSVITVVNAGGKREQRAGDLRQNK